MAAPGATTEYTFRHLVIVHGIGDQKLNETAITFMNEFVRAMPDAIRDTVEVHNLVGRVDDTLAKGPRPAHPAYITLDEGTTRHAIAFSEVYWQPVTNEYLADHNDETPVPIFPWAHSINTRIVKDGSSFKLVREAIDNLETMLGLLRSLAAISRKSKILADVLVKFLGDVQMYVESEDLRDQINSQFFAIMASDEPTFDQVSAQLGDPPWDEARRAIYVIAHSEGTVVSYYSLVQAAQERHSRIAEHEWFTRVRGLVTLGSPLDKHYFIWRNRFLTATLEDVDATPPEARIPWFNYWDRSDPVGFCLDELKTDDPASDAAKLFDVKYDRGFARYPIPGKAHVDYWHDRDIHLDVLQKVMGIGGPRPQVVGSRLWGHSYIMQPGEILLYLLGRMVEIGAILFFLSKLLEPVHGKLQGLAGWMCRLPGFACGVPVAEPVAVGWTIWLFVPVVALKVWQEIEARLSGDAFFNWPEYLRGAILAAWLVLMALALPQFGGALDPQGCEKFEIKNWIGYSIGLVVSILVWKLHTTVHKGLIQLWRYTTGWKPLRGARKPRAERRSNRTRIR